MLKSNDWKLSSGYLDQSKKRYPKPDQRVGMRAGMSDAASICNAISLRIMGSGRISKHRSELAAVAKQCAEVIEAMCEQVDIPK